MANPGKKHTGRSADTNRTRTTGRDKRGAKAIREPGGKLDKVSDAPESGEPREQGRSRGRIVES